MKPLATKTLTLMTKLCQIGIFLFISVYAGISSADSGSCIEPLKIMTYNTLLRAGGLLTDVKDTCRAKAIGDRIKRNPRWDIMAFQEVWDEDSVELLKRLGDAKYRYQYAKKAGLVIAYKHPIFLFKEKKVIPFNSVERASTEFFATFFGIRKGFLAVKVSHKSGDYWIIATHTQASEGAQRTRIKQIQQIRSFIDTHKSPTILLGDFNIKNNSNLIRSIIGESFINLSGPKLLVTSQCGDQDLDQDSCYPNFNGGQLDYIFGNFHSIPLTTFTSKVYNFSTVKCGLDFLSDHRVLETSVKLKIDNPEFSCSECESGYHKELILTSKLIDRPFDLEACTESCSKKYPDPDLQYSDRLACHRTCLENANQPDKIRIVVKTEHCILGTKPDEPCTPTIANAIGKKKWNGKDENGKDRWGECQFVKCKPDFVVNTLEGELLCVQPSPTSPLSMEGCPSEQVCCRPGIGGCKKCADSLSSCMF